MELRHLRYFLAICEEMNFTKAAEKLLIAQPPLSRQIKDLEAELGTDLFIREHHQLKLTEEGVLFRDYATRIIALADRSMEDIKEMNEGLTGTLYIASVEGKAPHLISSWISEFSKQYPKVQYHLWNGNSDEVTYRISQGLCDIAVVVAPYNPTKLHSVDVYKEPWIALFSSSHPLASKNGDTVSIKQLADYDLIIPSKTSREQEITDWFAPFGVSPHIKARIAHVLNAYELCEQNVGVAIYPAAAADLIKRNNLMMRTISPEREAIYSLVYSAEHPLSPIAQRFFDFVIENTHSAS